TKSQTGVPSMDSVNKAISDAGGAPIGADGKAAALPKAKLQVLSGGFAGKELELNKALTTLGRPGVQVAAVTRRADGFFVVHVESGQGQGFPTVNGKEIGAQAQKLADNDVIELAGVKMGFYEMK
ncbi:MAG TPA: FHA domain-containing protein, partial [Gammaproteobacteria bacterium]